MNFITPILITLIYSIVIIYAIHVIRQKFINKKLSSEIEKSSNNDESAIPPLLRMYNTNNGTKLSDIRVVKYPMSLIDEFKKFTIHKNFVDAFNMYVSINGPMLETLIKCEKYLFELENDIDNMTIEEFDVRADNIRNALVNIENLSIDLVDKLNEKLTSTIEDEDEAELSRDLVECYMNIINNLKSIGTRFINIKYRLYNKITNKFPNRRLLYLDITEKLIYILFIEINSCAERFDYEIKAYLN